MYVYVYAYVYVDVYIHISADPIGVERVRATAITSNQPPSPTSKQGTIHQLRQSPGTEPFLPGQLASQPAESLMTKHLSPANPTPSQEPTKPWPPSLQPPIATNLQHPARQPSISLPSANGLPMGYFWNPIDSNPSGNCSPSQLCNGRFTSIDGNPLPARQPSKQATRQPTNPLPIHQPSPCSRATSHQPPVSSY